MMRLPLVGLIVATVGLVIVLIVAPEAAAAGWRLAFVVAGAPVAGAVLLLLIARLVGARWDAFAPLAAAAPLLVIGAVGIGVIQIASPAPHHLGAWQSPLSVGIRAVAATVALAWAGARVRSGASATFAGVALSVYAVVSTAIGSDWLLGGAPGHSVSAIGMMIATQEIGAASAVMLLAGGGGERFRRDMGMLLTAAGLGLSYMIFMDYLITWYGDLPAKVGWYAARATPLRDAIAALALICGLFVPIGAQWRIGGRTGQRIAGASALLGLALIDLWWIRADLLALAAGVCAAVMLLAAGALTATRRHAHG